ncbi:MAG: hypothetical protein HY512_02610 [Candidatus Aenigmarchaeota archaeon]|nr:hypothetical protein [Candidatus Aenigmarchaeota archaeon]
MQCQSCFEELTGENRKEHMEHRLRNHHTNELCDACLRYFVIRNMISGKYGK